MAHEIPARGHWLDNSKKSSKHFDVILWTRRLHPLVSSITCSRQCEDPYWPDQRPPWDHSMTSIDRIPYTHWSVWTHPCDNAMTSIGQIKDTHKTVRWHAWTPRWHPLAIPKDTHETVRWHPLFRSTTSIGPYEHNHRTPRRHPLASWKTSMSHSTTSRDMLKLPLVLLTLWKSKRSSKPHHGNICSVTCVSPTSEKENCFGGTKALYHPWISWRDFRLLVEWFFLPQIIGWRDFVPEMNLIILIVSRDFFIKSLRVASATPHVLC